ncbi:MAG: hypothetical protein CVU48_05230 [Candidatus Cloacimonetes bacterium HGW-Cloacimonetes-1]|jgi:uncharacterized spore protein YtfJ|nr:MAG: hypothetical protein CVU48_05230 [Candidatus Cloacimonetes bacterium HGW-Cloacimonetes-1]
MKFNEILNQVKSVLTSFTGANLSFGKPMTVNEMTIIPVAKTSFGFGGGGGNSGKKKSSKSRPESDKPVSNPAAEPDEQPLETPVDATTPAALPEDSYGGGGGGGLKTNPIGIYVIRGTSVKFYPVLRYEQILATLTVISAIIIRFIKLKRK